MLMTVVFLWLGNVAMAFCTNSTQCLGWETCINNTCIPNNNNVWNTTLWTIEAWWICTQNLDCQSWLTCLAGHCITDPNAWNTTIGTFCSDTILCPGWQVCVGNQCITNTSTITTDCGSCRKLASSEYLNGCNSTEVQKTCSSDPNEIYCCPKNVWNVCMSPEWSVFDWLRCACPDAGGIKQIAVDGVCKKCNADDVCCGVKLNTKVPFIGNCIESKKDYVGGNSETSVTWEEAFPVLMWSLTKILVTVILIVSFLLIVAGGIMIATGDPAGGKKMIIKVVVGIAILWASWVILRLINPNFFG